MERYSVVRCDAAGNKLWYEEDQEWNSNTQRVTNEYEVDLEQGTYYIKVNGSANSEKDT